MINIFKRLSKKMYLRARILLFVIWLICLGLAGYKWQWMGLFFVWISGQIVDNILREIEKKRFKEDIVGSLLLDDVLKRIERNKIGFLK